MRQVLGMRLEGQTCAEHLALADLEMETELARDASVFWLSKEGMLGAVGLTESSPLWRFVVVARF